VFLYPGDYERFMEQLDAALEADGVVLYAYVLMPNHLNSVRRLATRGGAPLGVWERVGGREGPEAGASGAGARVWIRRGRAETPPASERNAKSKKRQPCKPKTRF
jgi:hypothetical protein